MRSVDELYIHLNARTKPQKEESLERDLRVEALDLGRIDKLDVRSDASSRQKEKAEPGTRLASRLSLVRIAGLEPVRRTAPEPKSGVSANSTISA